MADEEQQFPSRLRRNQGQPLRGVGSAYPQNQRMAGVQSHTEAARLAGMSPEEAEEEADRLERLAQDMDAMREDLLIAILENQWKPDSSSWPKAPSNQDEWKALLERQPAGMISKWHKEMNENIDAKVDAEDEAALRESITSLGVADTEDPLYDPLMDKQRKRAIEEGLEPLDFEAMVFTGSCTQEVPLRESFKVTFRTLGTQHGLWIEYFMSQQPETSFQHTRHLFSLMQVACCLEAVNGKEVGSDMTKFVRPSDRDAFVKALEERMEFLGRMPSVITDDLIVQYIWFCGRVRKLLAGDLMRKVGNS